MRRRWFCVLVLLWVLPAGAPARAADLALVGAKIYPSPSEPAIENGTIVVHDGRIVAGACGAHPHAYAVARRIQKPTEGRIEKRMNAVVLPELRAYSEAGGQILFGTDVGYIEEFDTAEKFQWMSRAGMSFSQILAALTTNPEAFWLCEPARADCARDGWRSGGSRRGPGARLDFVFQSALHDCGREGYLRGEVSSGKDSLLIKNI